MNLYCLITDDEPLAQDIIESYVARIDGIELVAVCGNLLETFDVLNAHAEINVVFMDVELPIYTALDWTSLTDFQHRTLWIVLITAYPPSYLREIEPGFAYAILHKPVSFNRFKDVVDQLLTRPKKD